MEACPGNVIDMLPPAGHDIVEEFSRIFIPPSCNLAEPGLHGGAAFLSIAEKVQGAGDGPIGGFIAHGIGSMIGLSFIVAAGKNPIKVELDPIIVPRAPPVQVQMAHVATTIPIKSLPFLFY